MKEWTVQLLGTMEETKENERSKSFELFVVKDSNSHGKKSWGWGDENKIILFGSGPGGNELNPGTKEQYEFARDVAQKLCDALNNEVKL